MIWAAGGCCDPFHISGSPCCGLSSPRPVGSLLAHVPGSLGSSTSPSHQRACRDRWEGLPGECLFRDLQGLGELGVASRPVTDFHLAPLVILLILPRCGSASHCSRLGANNPSAIQAIPTSGSLALCSAGEAPPGVLCPVLGPRLQEGGGQFRNNKNHQGPGRLH